MQLRILKENEMKKFKGKRHIKENPFEFQGLDF